MTLKMTDDEITELEEEIVSARYHLEGALSMIVDPYARGNLAQHLDKLVHSANKWLDQCIAEAGNGAVPTAKSPREPSQVSDDTLGKESA